MTLIELRPGFVIPIYATSLIELPWLLRELDRKYGNPDLMEPKKTKGGYAIRFILKYLSEHKQSTCEEIAKYEYEKNIRTKRKLKSITDDVRKFVKNNLIRSHQLVYEDGTKKVKNKHIQAYSLSPMGILYSMHLLANFRETQEHPYWHDFELSRIDRNLLRNLVKEYSQTLPKVFGRSKLFEKIVGIDFESLLINSFLNIFSEETRGIPNQKFLLNDYVLTGFYYTNPNRLTVHGFIAEQISLIFHIHLRESIEMYLWDKESGIDVLREGTRDEIDKFFKDEKKNPTKSYKEHLKIARKKWLEIMKEDKELKNWFNNFLKEAVESKKRDQRVVTQYQKEVFSSKIIYL